MDLLVVFSTIQDRFRESPGQYSSLSTMEREEEMMPGEKRKERLLLFQTLLTMIFSGLQMLQYSVFNKRKLQHNKIAVKHNIITEYKQRRHLPTA